jgi:hypothetical protein
MAETGEPFRFRIRHSATAPISIQITLSTAEGSAPWYQPLTMKPAAPTTFIAWYSADRPLTLPIDSNK